MSCLNLPAFGVWGRVEAQGSTFSIEVCPDEGCGPPQTGDVNWGEPETWLEEGSVVPTYSTEAEAWKVLHLLSE